MQGTELHYHVQRVLMPYVKLMQYKDCHIRNDVQAEQFYDKIMRRQREMAVLWPWW